MNAAKTNSKSQTEHRRDAERTLVMTTSSLWLWLAERPVTQPRDHMRKGRGKKR